LIQRETSPEVWCWNAKIFGWLSMHCYSILTVFFCNSCPLFGTISYPIDASRLDDDTPANMALQFHMNVSLNRPPDSIYGVAHRTSSSTSYETIPHIRLQTFRVVLSTKDMVVKRRDGPRRLRTTFGNSGLSSQRLMHFGLASILVKT